MNIGGRIFAHFYDRFLAASEEAGLTAMRTGLLAHASGSVLEIGAGTGLNLGLYPKEVSTLTLTEPSEYMIKHLTPKLDQRVTQVVQAPAESLPFADGTFDTVVSTLVMCTVSDPAQTLREIKRVLGPDGRFLFLEHVRAQSPKLAKWQDRLNPINKVVADGCNCNRNTLGSIGAAGFTVLRVSAETFPKAPPPLRPLIWGIAKP